MQSLLVALIVTGCCTYAVWVLMPTAVRRIAAEHLLRWPLPGLLTRPLRRAAQRTSACSCDGCDAKKPAPSNQAQPIRIHRQPRA